MRILCWLCLLLTLNVQAETYKWKDKNGSWQYGSTPPLGVKAETIRAAADPNSNAQPKTIIHVDDVDALPYLTKNTDGGRKAYQEYLAAKAPKLFVACANGKYYNASGEKVNYDILLERIRKIPDYNANACHPYAYNSEVVWNRKK